MNGEQVKLIDTLGREIEPVERAAPSGLDRDFFRWAGATGGEITSKDVESKPYKFHYLIFACCNYILRNVSRLPWYMYDINNPQKMVFDDPLIELLCSPHPLLNKTSFLQAIILSVLLPSGGIGRASKGGQCFILCMDKNGDPVDLNRGQLPVLLTPMNDTYITPKTIEGKGGLKVLSGWSFKIDAAPSSEQIYAPNQLIRVCQFNPYSWVEGIANFHPAMLTLSLDLKSDLYNDSIFENLGVPSGLLSTEVLMTPDNRKEEMRYWNETMSGYSNAQKIAILSKGLKYQHIGLTNVDMQYSEMKKFVQESQISAFGLNKIAIGNYEQINFATIVEGRKMLWHDVNLPMIDLICDAINYSLVRFIDRNKRIGLDTSKVEYLQPNYKDRSITASTLVEKCFLPPVMALRKVGIPLSDDELATAPWLAMNPLEMKSQFAPAPFSGTADDESPKKDDKPEKSVVITRDSKEKWWFDYVERILDPEEKSYSKAIYSFFNQQRNLFQDKVDEWLAKQKKAVIISLDDILIDKRKEDQKLIDLSRPMHVEQLKRTEKQLEKELGELIRWHATDETIDKSLNRRAKFLRGLNNTTFKSVEKEAIDLFNQANTENWAPGKFAKELKSAFNSIYEERKNQTMTIARTEIGSVTEDARYIAFTMEDIEWHEWVSAMDEKVRETHTAENGHVVRLGERFPVTKLLHPLDDTTNEPAEVINCRCVNVAAEAP